MCSVTLTQTALIGSHCTIRVDGTIQTSKVEDCSKQIKLWESFVMYCTVDVTSYEDEDVIKISKLMQVTGAINKDIQTITGTKIY